MNLVMVLLEGSVRSRLVEVVDFSYVGRWDLVDRVSVVVVLLLAGSLRNENERDEGRREGAPSGDDESEDGSLILVCVMKRRVMCQSRRRKREKTPQKGNSEKRKLTSKFLSRCRDETEDESSWDAWGSNDT